MNGAATPVLKDLVLVGGGHSHVFVLKAFGMTPLPGVRITLVCRDVHTPYSGMLPGLIAGHYDFDEAHIDLQKLARFGGARFFHDEVVGLDLDKREVRFRSRPPLGYDVLSIDIGSNPARNEVPGAERYATAVKPIGRLVAKWEAVIARTLEAKGAWRIGVVGAGAAGVEVTLAMQYRLRELLRAVPGAADPEFHLFSSSPDVLPSHNRWVRSKFGRILEERGVRVHPASRVTSVTAEGVVDQGGGFHPLDEVLWTTQAAAQSWPAEAGLQVDERGFIQVDDTLQSLSHPNVLAAGDVATMVNHPREKAGVFAVRQGPPLAENVRRLLLGRRPERFRPQKRFLSLVSTGDKYAVASRSFWALEGGWVWNWKDSIDRKFMAKFGEELPKTMEHPPATLHTGLADDASRHLLSAGGMRCAGCGSKLGSGVLEKVLAKIEPLERDDVLVGLRGADDAAVWRVPCGKVAVQSVDFFGAIVNDPYVFGKIAAEHALSDLYAMGAEPQSALATAIVPYGLPPKEEQALFHLLSGANEVLREAGAALIGGHSTEGTDLALGLTVNGFSDPEDVWRKGGAQPGDRLILTKALGTGTLFAAEMARQAKGRWIAGAIASMLRSNRAAAGVLRDHGARSCTDVTGFGLLGHLLGLLRADDLGADLALEDLPILDGALETAAAGLLSTLHPENLRAEQALVPAAGDPGAALRLLLFDPQTSGGLLAAVPPDRALACLTELHEKGYPDAAVIGTVQPTGGVRLTATGA
ncbi:MAG: selenide, water dikinase SelD [Acidobacteria bacterium]|nr:selenide, water dikinase SelD [Acidobacteriota bacterium]